MGIGIDDVLHHGTPVNGFGAFGGRGIFGVGVDGGGGGSGGDPYAMMDPAQAAARAKLASFMDTGKFGDFTAGAEVPLGYGDFNMTGIEGMGQSKLRDLLANGIPDQYRLGNDALAGILDGSQANMDRQFSAFNDQSERAIGESERALKRSAGFSGNLYSTDTIRGLGDIRARGNESKITELGRLTDQALSRRLQAVPLAYQGAESQQNAQIGQINAASQFGQLTRMLNDQSIKARDAELLRRRTELSMPIDVAKGLASSNVQWGTTPVQQSPYAQLLGTLGQVGGMYLGSFAGGAGAAAGGALGRQALTPSTPTPAPAPSYTPGYGMPPWRS